MENMVKVGIGVMILQDGKILLGHRAKKAKDTGGIYEPDSWCLPGGKQEYKESVLEGAKREVKEETNLSVSQLEVFGVNDDIQPDRHYLTVWVIARACEGELKVMEAEKQDAWQWFSLDALPKRLYSPSKRFIEEWKKKQQCCL